MCKSYCYTFLLWLGQQRLEFLEQFYTQNTLIATLLEVLRRKEQRHSVAVVVPFFRDTLNNQCCLQSNPYSPYPCLQDIKHQLLCQILFRSQEWQVGHTNEAWIHTWRHTHRVTHKLYSKHTQAVSLASSSLPLPQTHTQIHIHPPKAILFWKGKWGALGERRGDEECGSLANVHNEKCKLCHFLQIKVFWWEPETIAAH